MKIPYKILINKSMKETTIGRWIKPTGFELPMIAIHNPLFNSSLNFCFGKYAEFRRFLLETYDVEIDNDEPVAVFVHFRNKKDDNKMAYFINLQSNEFRATDYGTIVHELHHFVHHSLNHIGMWASKDSEEVYAYSIGFFMERIMRALVIYKKKYK